MSVSMSTRNGVASKIVIAIVVIILIAGIAVFALWLTHYITDNKAYEQMESFADAISDAFVYDEDGKLTSTPSFIYLGKFDVDYVKEYIFSQTDLSASSATWGDNNNYPNDGCISLCVSDDGTTCYLAYQGFQWGCKVKILAIDLTGKVSKVTSMNLPEVTNE